MRANQAVYRIAMLLGACLALGLAAAPALAQTPDSPLVVAYPDRPPYNYTVDGQPQGALYELAARIFAQARVQAVFREMPVKRIQEGLQRPGSRLCSCGWFRNEAREKFARFSLPMSQDTPLVAVILASTRELLGDEVSLAGILATPGVTLGLVRGWSYGSYVDGMARKYSGWIEEAPSRPLQAAMLARGRFTCTLVRESEVESFIGLTGLEPRHVLVLPLTDLRERPKRHVLCGRGLSPEVLGRIDAAIRELGLGAEDVLALER